MTENLEKPVDGRKCKFLEIEVIQNTEHQKCISPKMKKANKLKDGKILLCVASSAWAGQCECAEYE